MKSLELLRFNPANAVRANGFLVSSYPSQAGRCDIIPSLGVGNITHLDVFLSPTGRDWFFPDVAFRNLCVAVPKSQPDGTLVITPGMNGCALEVREKSNCNIFFHDYFSIGQPMELSEIDPARYKFRVDANQYMCPDEIPQTRLVRHLDSKPHSSVNYLHSIFCVKQHYTWHVFNNAVQTVSHYDGRTGSLLNQDAWQVKDTIPYELGTFPD